MACYQKGPDNYVEGLKALERARYLGALDDRIFWYAARMYEDKGLSRFAAEDYERYLRNRSWDIDARLRLASLYYKDGDAVRALKNYDIVMNNWPRDPTALYDVASIYYQQGNYSKAQPLFEKCLSLSGDLPFRGHFMLGQSYEVKGLYQQALTEYRKGFAKDKSDLNLLKALAGTYEHLGSKNEAKQIWNMAFKAYPNDAYVRLKVGKPGVVTRASAKAGRKAKKKNT
jgi:tetratricopeptide (TPR) repeat protein